MIQEKVKNLWKLCFNDSEEFTEMYFQLRYNNDVNIAIQSGEEVIAALQMLPYPMTFEGEDIHTAYISGACTHPDYRNRGVMQELLSQAFARMLHNNASLSTLIPAEPWLFDYYARSGYAPVFRYTEETFIASDTPAADTGFTLEMSAEYTEKKYEYFNRKLRECPCCIQHTEEDFRVIIADLQLEKGSVCTLNKGEKITALAITYPIRKDYWRIGEIVSDTPATKTLLLQLICQSLNLPSVRVLTPPATDESQLLGMARIINAKTMLQIYAAAHPELKLNIHLTDEQVSANNGYYYLNNGKCMNSAKRLPGSHLALTIGELTEKIFTTSSPYMSLMLN
ncbi:GNAT family N-acetyltransferase [uncultured Bacteroides sp.]|jgi:predicted acetyltransferase|uniref:GNAT family N-acetyltransferase n=1 Tax=uncultured Bacteroides sp. TaxID=162156 RepID=UPI002592D438|nr:GNAT family N-acetyltransferase [uncultured Bacteroides sp.]